MSLFSDMRTALTSDSAVMARARAIYRGIPSQEAPSPFVSIHVIGDSPQTDFEGEDDLQNMVLQVDCWASDLDTARALFLDVKAALFSSSITLLRRDYRELYDGDSRLWRASSDWSTWSLG